MIYRLSLNYYSFKLEFSFRFLMKFCFILLFLVTSCSTPYMGKDVCGADQFVIDSYKIREGKFSILEMEGKCFDKFPVSFLDEYKDTIHEDDILKIEVYHPKRSDITQAVEKIGNSIGYRVSDGKIQLPDLPLIHVSCLTLLEAKEKIQNLYLTQISDIEVFIEYKNRIARKVELAGLVAISSVPVDGKIRLFDVLSVAKVPPNANFFKSYLIRDNKLISVDFNKLIKEGDMSQNIVMRGGDKIYIADPSSSNLMVLGEVGCETIVNLPKGYMSLREALAAARGIPFTGDKSYIQVIRGAITCPKIYTLSWKHVIHLPNDSLLLMPGDVVYVAAKPITEWNRFISQLLPCFTGLDVIGKGCRSWGVFIP
jgi:polysaccharide biosynthesis/export protein